MSVLDIPARYARDPRIAHVGGHHIVIAGGARVYERTSDLLGQAGRFEAIASAGVRAAASNTGTPRRREVFERLAAAFAEVMPKVGG